MDTMMPEDEQDELLERADKLTGEAARLIARVLAGTGAPRPADQIAATLEAVAMTAIRSAAEREYPLADEGGTA